MSQSLVLLAYAAVMGTMGAALLRRAQWPQSLPRLGVAAWQVLSLSVVIALMLTGLTALVPDINQVSINLAVLLDACVMALRAQYATPGGALLHASGVGVMIGLVARTGYLLFAGLREARRSSREHLESLVLAARRDPDLDAYVVEHPAAAAYCLPGRARTVVLTSAAVDVLDDDELRAVLAHERGHLRGRHHLVLAAAEALERAMPFLPVFAWARSAQRQLLEMAADDTAVDRSTRLTVARALVHLAEGAVPRAALGAADVDALVRVRRLLDEPVRVGALRKIVIVVAMLTAVVFPVTIAAGPALASTQMDYCPIPAIPGPA